MIMKKNVRPVHTSDEGTHVYKEDAVVYTTTRAEALTVDTSDLVQGSVLFVIREAKMYLLDEDGGDWYNVSNGTALEEDA